MRLEGDGQSVVIVRDDGSQHAIEGPTLPLGADFGLSNRYRTEIREHRAPKVHADESAVAAVTTHPREPPNPGAG
jgi:hypothetical protein